MKLDRINIENFKSIKHADLFLNGKNTIIFGVNGTGKSTVLSAINFLTRTWINRINSNQSKDFEKFTDNDITVGMDFLNINGVFCMENKKYNLSRGYRKTIYNERLSQITYDKKEYESFVNDFRKDFLEKNDNMPVYVFYSTNRSVLGIYEKFKDQHYDMVSALDRVMSNSVDFKKFFEWYRDRESKETIDIRESIDNHLPIEQDSMLKNVRFAIESVIENVSDLRIRRDPVRMTVNKNGKEVRVDMLSDGEKCMLALVGDLARRLCLANPGLEDPFKGRGIVLIDEIELHMHPSWQREILAKLIKLFPNIQFIVTTHSPQVLGEADDTFMIYLIDDKSGEFKKISRLDGYDSNLILEEYMNTSCKNKNTKDIIEKINTCIIKKEYNKAKQKLSDLREIVGDNNADYILAKGFLERSININA